MKKIERVKKSKTNIKCRFVLTPNIYSILWRILIAACVNVLDGKEAFNFVDFNFVSPLLLGLFLLSLSLSSSDLLSFSSGFCVLNAGPEYVMLPHTFLSLSIYLCFEESNITHNLMKRTKHFIIEVFIVSSDEYENTTEEQQKMKLISFHTFADHFLLCNLFGLLCKSFRR